MFEVIAFDADDTLWHNEIIFTEIQKKFEKLLSSKKSDLVLTTRFKSKNSLKDWPIFRKFLTYLRLKLTKFILNMDYDASGAYRCFKTKKIWNLHHY